MPRGCGYYRGQFVPYIGGELPTEERRELARHLRGCQGCAEAFSQEWRAFLGFSPASESTGPPALAPRGGLLAGKSVRLAALLVPAALLGLLFLAATNRPRTGPESAPEAGGGIGSLLEAQGQLLDSLVSVARQRQSPVSREVAFGAMRLLDEAHLALERPDPEALRRLVHPRFRLTALTEGGLPERSLDREGLLREPSLAAALLDLGRRSQLRWWSAEERTVTLYLLGESGSDAALVVLLQGEEGLALFWAQVPAQGHARALETEPRSVPQR